MRRMQYSQKNVAPSHIRPLNTYVQVIDQFPNGSKRAGAQNHRNKSMSSTPKQSGGSSLEITSGCIELPIEELHPLGVSWIL